MSPFSASRINSSLQALVSSGKDDPLSEKLREKLAWYKRLSWKHQDDLPSRLDLQIKGLYALASPSNHPGRHGRNDAGGTDDPNTRLEVLIEMLHLLGNTARKALQRSSDASLGATDHATEPSPQTEPPSNRDSKETPSPAVAPLKHLADFMEDLVAILKIAADSGTVPPDLVHRAGALIRREIDQSAYFRPSTLVADPQSLLSGVPPPILKSLASIEGEPSSDPMTITVYSVLSLHDVIDRLAGRPNDPPLGLYESTALLSLVRALCRTLGRFMIRDAPRSMAHSFGDVINEISADKIQVQYPGLSLNSNLIFRLQNVLRALGYQLRLESYRTFELEIPSIRALLHAPDPQAMLTGSLKGLKAFIEEALAILTEELPAADDAKHALFSSPDSRTARLDRLRRDAWMFTQVTRAFMAKAKSSAAEADDWTASDAMQFAREFTVYFRSMAHALLLRFPYEREAELMEMLESLREGGTLFGDQGEKVLEECERFRGFLDQTKTAIDTGELKDVPFDRKAAARVLKFYLGY